MRVRRKGLLTNDELAVVASLAGAFAIIAGAAATLWVASSGADIRFDLFHQPAAREGDVTKIF